MEELKADVIFTGLERIGRQFHRSGRTVRRWIAREGFPAARLPNDEWATTLPLISDWIRERARKSGGNNNA